MTTFYVWALGWLHVLFGDMKFVRTCVKRARGVLLDFSKPFILNLDCKRKVIVRLPSISLLEVVRVILELLNAGKLALETCSECIQQQRCAAGASFPRGKAHPRAHCQPGALVPCTRLCEWAQASFPSSLRDGDKGRLQTGFVSLTITQGSLLWLLGGANAFVRFTLPIRKENLFHPCHGEVHQGIIFGELTYCCLLML